MSSYDYSARATVNPNAEVRSFKLPDFSDDERPLSEQAVVYEFTPFDGEEKVDPQAILDEANRKAERITADAAAEADRLKAEAAAIKAEAEALKAGAHAEGYKKGYAEGEAAGREEGRKSFDEQAAPPLVAFGKIENLYGDLWRVNEAALIKLTIHVAEKVIFRELSTSPDLILEAFKSALDQLDRQHQAVFRLHPDDKTLLESVRGEALQNVTGLMKISFEEDAGLSRGDLVMETDSGRLDGTLKRRMEAVFKAVDDVLEEKLDLDW